MEQIYYTQCPIGYGLGATNGFQVKRLSAGYPTTGDIRHLGLRAFLPGTRTPAPGALRYRRDGEIAEIAWLHPRSHEYETENGRLWGRPGGQFAHGLRMSAQELAALGNWPSGLYDRPFWVRSDPEPSRGRAPEPLVLSRDDLVCPPTFPAVAPFARAMDEERLARLLTATARATRENRTVFVVDTAPRLGSLFALLTFAFPEGMRLELTFSTYHDRPEELSGFRLQGTVPEARPNRLVLGRLGLIVDLISGTCEPPLEPARWARTLAGWLCRGDSEAETAWNETNRRSARARPPSAPEERWSDAWLDELVGMHNLTRLPVLPAHEPPAWRALTSATIWAAHAGLADELSRSRDPAWWQQAASEHAQTSEAREAFLTHLRVMSHWRDGDESRTTTRAAGWGHAAAHWFAPRPAAEREASLVAILRLAPEAVRGAFLAGFVRCLDPVYADYLITRLKQDRNVEEAYLLPIESSRIAALERDTGRSSAADEILPRALSQPSATASVLESIAVEVGSRADLLALWADRLAAALTDPNAPGSAAAWAWSLGRRDARTWLVPYVRRVYTHPDRRDAWRGLNRRTPPQLRPNLADVAITAAIGDNVPADALVWAVEELFLPLKDRPPTDPAWPDAYLDRVAGLDLARWLFLKESRQSALADWLGPRIREGTLSSRNNERLRAARRYVSVLHSHDPGKLEVAALPDVPPARRGELLDHLLRHLGATPDRSLGPALETCRQAWNGGFAPGDPGLEGLGHTLADALMIERVHPSRWLERVEALLDRIGLTNGPNAGFESDGLAAQIVAATAQLATHESSVWPLRKSLFKHELAWRVLRLDIRSSLGDEDRRILRAGLTQWDQNLTRGTRELEIRFHELIFNACPNGRALSEAVQALAASLPGLGRLSWWGLGSVTPPLDDVRDAFARLAPMEPLDIEAMKPIDAWMTQTRPTSRRVETVVPTDFDLDDVDLVPVEPGGGAKRSREAPKHLTAAGFSRWRCLWELSYFASPRNEAMGRIEAMKGWHDEHLPLGALPVEDRKRFLAVAVDFIKRFEAPEKSHEFKAVTKFAQWLVGDVGLRTADQYAAWLDAPIRAERIEPGEGGRAFLQALKDQLRDEWESPPAISPGGTRSERPDRI